MGIVRAADWDREPLFSIPKPIEKHLRGFIATHVVDKSG
jgi:hypothetical protein